MSRVFTPKPAPLPVGAILPAACDAHDLARVFGKSLNTIYDWHRDGRLRRFELRKPMTSRRWSGRLVQEFLDGGTGIAGLRRVS
jgi:hypothetical protein